MPVPYKEIRPLLKTGDVVGFGGKGRVAELIKWRTGSRFSHVGVVYVATLNGGPKNVWLVESTTLSKRRDRIFNERLQGLQIHLLSDRLKDHEDACIASVREDIFNKINKELYRKADDLLVRDLRKRVPYDYKQAIGAGIDWWDRWFENDEDFSALFCSEFVALDHERRGWFPKIENASEPTPHDAMTWKWLSPYEEIQV